ncbi:unnamed protein product, partial [Prunus brigantina]
ISFTFLSSSPLFPNPSRTQHSLIASFIFIFITFGRQCHHLRPLRLPSDAAEQDVEEFDILNWWRVNASKYPVLAAIARDVLAIPVSTVASESTFSTGGRTINSFRSSLSPAVVEALICTQNWLKSTSISLEVEPTIEEMEFYETIESEMKKSNAMGPLHVSYD